MYQEFFGLKEKPFEVTPDTKYLYLTPDYKELLAAILYGIHERRGFIAVVGEVGTGKTMMLNAVIDRLNTDVRTAFIYNSDLTAKQMLLMILFELGVATAKKNITKVEAIQRLHEYALDVSRENGNIVIIIDEAHLLAHSTMENLRMLSNLETKKEKLIQFILAGQPELDEKLMLPEWRQLVQRISLKRYSTQFDEDNTYKYIQYRLTRAGKKNGDIFSEKAMKSVFEYSKGIPRVINILCDNAMLIGYGLEEKLIEKNIIEEVVKDMYHSPFINSIDLNINTTQKQNLDNPKKEKDNQIDNANKAEGKNAESQIDKGSAQNVVAKFRIQKFMLAIGILALLLISFAVFYNR